MTLDNDVRDFIRAGNFGTITTLFPSGQPQTNVMWVDADDDHVIVNTEVHRAKFANMQNDPRVTLCVWDKDNPYRYVEVRGRVVATEGGQAAVDHINEASRRYTGADYAPEIQSERVIVKIEPQRVYSRI